MKVEKSFSIITGVILGKIIYHFYKAYKSYKNNKKHKKELFPEYDSDYLFASDTPEKAG